MNNKTLYAEVETSNYKGIYKVHQFFGSLIVLIIDDRNMDFRIFEIKRFTDENGNNLQYKF